MANTQFISMVDPNSGIMDQQYQAARAQRLADLLSQDAAQPIQSSSPTAPIAWSQVLGKLLAGYGAQKKQDQAFDAQKQMMLAQDDYYAKLLGAGKYGNVQPAQAPIQTQQPPALAPAPANTDTTSVEPLIQRAPGQTLSDALAAPPQASTASAPVQTLAGFGAAPAAPQQLPSLTGDRNRDMVLLRNLGPQKYMEALAEQYKPTDTMRDAVAAYGSGTPAYTNALRQHLTPNQVVAPGGSIVGYDPTTNSTGVQYAAPNAEKGFSPVVQDGRVVGVQALPGATDVAAGMERATNAAHYSTTPIVTPDPIHPGHSNVQFPTIPGQPAGAVGPAGGGGAGGGVGPAPGSAPAGNGALPTAADLEYLQARGKAGAAAMDTIQKAAAAAPTAIAQAQRIGSILGDFEGGKLTKAGMTVASAANSLGIKLDPKLGDKEAAEALSNQMALELRSTGSGGGMPGSMSDSDRQFLVSMAPHVGQTAQGRKMILQSYIAIQNRNQEVAQMASKWEAKYGSIISRNRDGETFQDGLSRWSQQHPLFGQQQ